MGAVRRAYAPVVGNGLNVKQGNDQPKVYKIVNQKDDTTKVALSRKARSPNNVLMPGVGKNLGSLNTSNKIQKPSKVM
jgi:hypothetical protein